MFGNWIISASKKQKYGRHLIAGSVNSQRCILMNCGLGQQRSSKVAWFCASLLYLFLSKVLDILELVLMCAVLGPKNETFIVGKVICLVELLVACYILFSSPKNKVSKSEKRC